MSLKQLVAGVIAAGLGCAVLATTADAAPAKRHSVNAREHRQAQRIRDGKQNGELTRGELNRLRGDEAAIRAEERVYRKSGDGLSPRERRDLQRDLNQTSREIYRAKHNDRQPQ